MTQPVHIMIDMETLGLHDNPPILSIGAAEVCRHPLERPMFYRAVEPEGSADFGTIAYWLKQASKNPEAANAVIQAIEEGGALEVALHDLNRYLLGAVGSDGDKSLFVWSKGSTFDIVILEAAMRKYGIKPAWDFRNVRCFRTVEAMFGSGVTSPETTVAHHALEDAIWQAVKLDSIFRVSATHPHFEV